ncbi:hypothetical protein A2U01_0088821, partial [Trifolium medium]|nr:hypothetical protein [Trifolium medium]
MRVKLNKSEIEGGVEKEKRMENESIEKGKKPLVRDSKSPSPLVKLPYPIKKKAKNQDLQFRKFLKMLNQL